MNYYTTTIERRFYVLTPLKNQRAFTLVEILAAFVLLVVVISFFLTSLPQMNKFNNLTGENLNAAHVAKDILVQVKKGNFSYLDNMTRGSEIALQDGTLSILEVTRNGTSSTPLILIGEYKSLLIEIEVKETDSEIQLRPFTINIKRDSTVITTTHGYIRN